MKVRKDVSLKSYNTFGIDARAKYFAELASTPDIIDFAGNSLGDYPEFYVLGGGSNTLFTEDYQGLILHITSRGINILDEDSDHVFLNVCAGEVWDQLVQYCVDQHYGGLENLSLIPGQVGAGPIQNIGAYGVELKDHFHELRALDLHNGQTRIFTYEDCEFGYRNSIFKNEHKGRYIILDITLRLDKQHTLHTDYGAIRQELEAMHIKQTDIRAIRDAVINIRSRKLPDPARLGNGGSFFKNPVISQQQHEILKTEFPGIVSYPQEDNKCKLAAGWLIEQAGWKGYRKGDAGVHRQQALVLVNYGNASGNDILELSEEIRDSVMRRFNVSLEREVNVI